MYEVYMMHDRSTAQPPSSVQTRRQTPTRIWTSWQAITNIQSQSRLKTSYLIKTMTIYSTIQAENNNEKDKRHA